MFHQIAARLQARDVFSEFSGFLYRRELSNQRPDRQLLLTNITAL